MKGAGLFNQLKKLGFPLFEHEEKLDANRTLADVVKSKELRLWEGFPVRSKGVRPTHFTNFSTIF